MGAELTATETGNVRVPPCASVTVIVNASVSADAGASTAIAAWRAEADGV